MTNLLQTESQALKLHIFYAGNYYNNDYFEYKLHSLFLRLNLFESAMMTLLHMQRDHLITKENVNLLTKDLRIDNSPLYRVEKKIGKLILRRYGKHVGVTTLTGFCDDLESFFEKNLAGKYLDKFEETHTYFLTKLTDEEMQLIDLKEENHLKTYSKYMYDERGKYTSMRRGNPDVDEKEMKLSDSKDKYVKYFCQRKTFFIDRNNYERTIDLPQALKTRRIIFEESSKKSKKCQIT